MKRIITAVLIIICILSLIGCGEREYELPWDHFCYSAENGGAIELEPNEKKFIINLLNKGNWYGELAKCTADVKFTTKKQSLGYSVDEGIFNDFTCAKSLRISENERLIINGYLDLGS